MSVFSPLRAVIDTNVVFEGLTKQGGVAGVIIEAWLDDPLAADILEEADEKLFS